MSTKTAVEVGAPQNGTLQNGTPQSGPPGSGTPHRRYHFSPAQTLELNQSFSLNPYPSVKDRQELATRLGIDQKVLLCKIFKIFSVTFLH